MIDCLIVGGGVVGLSLAYELAGRGGRVRLVERGQTGREASWAGAGILPAANQATAHHPLDQLRGLSFALHPEWAARLRSETGIDTGFRRCGGLYVASTAGEAAALVALQETCREEDVACERVPCDQLAAVEPGVSAEGLRFVCRLPDEAQLRNPHHLRALRLACERRGVEVLENAEVLGFTTHNGRLTELATTRGPLSAERVCLTSGAWTRLLLERLGLESGILPIRGQMVLFACDRPPFGHIINDGPRYLVARDDGHVLAGSTEEEAGFDKRTTTAAIAELTAFAQRLVPALRAATIERSWAGLRPGSFDGFPYLGAVPGLENLFVAAGHFRSGLYLSPGTAVVLGQLLRDERPEIDLTPFRVRLTRAPAQTSNSRTTCQAVVIASPSTTPASR